MALQELMQGVEGLKLGVQELQRDLTLRRCLAKEAAIGSLDARISEVEESLSKHLTEVEQKQPGLEKVIRIFKHFNMYYLYHTKVQEELEHSPFHSYQLH